MSRELIPDSYLDATKRLGARDTRKAGNNTYVERLGADCIGVRLHRTYVVKFWPVGVELQASGWWTVTTKDRINRALRGTSWRVASWRVKAGTEKVPRPIWEGGGFRTRTTYETKWWLFYNGAPIHEFRDGAIVAYSGPHITL